MRPLRSRVLSRALLALGILALCYGLLMLYEAYFVPIEGLGAIGAFLIGITLTCATGPLAWLALRLSPDASGWPLWTALLLAVGSAATMLVLLLVAGFEVGAWVAIGLAGAGLAAYEARRRAQ